MALEAVVFSQLDPFLGYNNCKDFMYSHGGESGGGSEGGGGGGGCGFLSHQYDYDFDHFGGGGSSQLVTESFNPSSSSTTSSLTHIASSNATVASTTLISCSPVNNPNPTIHEQDYHHQNHQYVVPCSNNNNINYYTSISSPPRPDHPVDHLLADEEQAPPGGAGRRKRRRRSTKNKEEVENQRMTHIAVERNRRKQMNDYLAVIRSLMPSSYVQRGDQASIIGGAINYVKELEQLLQSLEAQKRNSPPPPSPDQSPLQLQYNDQKELKLSLLEDIEDQLFPLSAHNKTNSNSCDADAAEDKSYPFSSFFTFPQYSLIKKPSTNECTIFSNCAPSISETNNNIMIKEESKSKMDAAGEIEVTVVDSHANVKILTKRQPRQLLKLVAGFHSLRLSVIHLNVTSTHDHLVFYSFNLKVEEGCHLSSVDEIASTTNHILWKIQEGVTCLV